MNQVRGNSELGCVLNFYFNEIYYIDILYTDGVRVLGGDRFVVYVGGNDEVVESVEIYVSVPDDI